MTKRYMYMYVEDDNFLNIRGMFYTRKFMAWCPDTQRQTTSQPTTAPQRKRLQHFYCVSFTTDGSLTCPSFLDCQDAMPTPPSYGCELPGPRLRERMG